MNKPIPRVKEDDFNKEGVELFGENRFDWKFVCPGCGRVQSVTELNKIYSGLEGLWFASVFLRCVGNVDDREGCKYNIDEAGDPGAIILVKNDGKELPMFDFYREEQNDDN